MKLRIFYCPSTWVPAAAFLLSLSCPGQESASTTTPSAKPSVSIDQYIHQSWDTLSRSMTDCHSLADPKLKTRPILYLPQDVPMPPQVKALETQCNLEVERLPRPIHRLGDVKVTEILTPGLLYLPNKYVVPGGRFNEMYGWDSYFIILGLTSDGRIELARGIVENFFYEIEHYGAILNANRTYHLTRSQPPFLTSMIRAVYDADVALHPGNRKQDEAWVRLGYQYAERDHALWESELHRAGDTGLAHYEDIGAGPVPEMEDDSTYYPDVICWLLDHPGVHTDYLVDGPESATPDQQEHLTEISCDPRISAVCARAHVDRHWLTREFYRGDRAMRESGFDPSFRFGPFSGSTQHFAPVCLNSLLYKYERDLAWMANLAGKPVEASRWNSVAQARQAAMDKYLWNPAKGMYFDYDYTNHKPSDYVYISTLYPLWAGAADKQQTAGVEQNLKLLERPGGIAMSTIDSGTQWDLPFGWAPCSWIAIQGLAISGDLNDAQRLSKKFMKTIQEGFEQDQTIREKYNVVSGNSDVRITTGYKMNVVGFGWTNGVYLKMQQLMTKSGPTSAGSGAQ